MRLCSQFVKHKSFKAKALFVFIHVNFVEILMCMWMLGCIIFICIKYMNKCTICRFCFVSAMTDDPRFAEPIPNVTVALGRDASLPCVVENLGTYKVQYTANLTSI